ncbi:MAG: PIN domain-containing protein [Janthinobacterium lividum]
MVGTKLFLLDTNIITYIVNGKSAAARKSYLTGEHVQRFAISAIVEAEIRFGLAKSRKATEAQTFMTEFLERTESVPWDTAAAKAYGFLRAETESQGIAFGALDLQIAAHAISLGATLVTHDRALQRAAPFCQVVDWATDVQ